MTLPLAGVRVLDMALLLPGALAASWLADLGATVIRIEPSRGGGILGLPRQQAQPYLAALRGSKEIRFLHLRDSHDYEHLLELVRESDILVEGFRPGSLENRGLGFEALSRINPRLIYCSISSFGHRGPRRDEPGHDINFMALAGLLEPNRGQDGVPHVPPVQLADVGGGTYPALVSILAALYARENTGRGQHLDVSLFDGTIAWNYFNLPLSLVSDDGYGLGLLTGGALCYNVYRCADERYIAMGALEPHFWHNVCDLLERPDLLHYAANPEPGAAERLAAFRDLLASRASRDWLELFGQKETLVTPLLSVTELATEPHLLDRDWVSDENGFPRTRFPVKFRD